MMNELSSFDLRDYLAPDAWVHFVGCGGVGTAPLMRIFHEYGFRVSGSDLVDNAFTGELRAGGLPVFTGHRAENLPDCPGSRLLVIHTSAAGPDNPELAAAAERGARLVLRGAALGRIVSIIPCVVTVSGSHGKTSVSAMIAFALRELRRDPGFLIGGAVCGWGGRSGSAGSKKIFVSEVDESDGTHALAHSSLGIVTNVEDDHAWNLGGVENLYRNFQRYAAGAQKLLYVGSETSDRLFRDHPDAVRLEKGGFSARFGADAAPRWGGFQRENALTALTALEMIGIDAGEAAAALLRFPGVERRMSIRYDGPDYRVIEDYAHHPTELRASLEALRETNPGRRLLLVFQPHRYARLERYFNEFVPLLASAARTFVTPVFAAWTASGRYRSEDLAAALSCPAEALGGSWLSMAERIAGAAEPGDLIAVIGAGDLKDLLPSLIECLERKSSCC